MIELQNSGYNVWKNVAGKVNKAVVFIDDSSAECLHWNGGAMLLFDNGAKDIKEFSSFESGSEADKKSVFILSRPLHGTTMSILHDIIRASNFQYVIVICSLSPPMHTIINHGLGSDDILTFNETEDQLLEWMGNMNYTVEVLYMPFVMAPITKQIFVLPEHSNMFPLLPSDLDTLLPRISKDQKQGLITDLEYSHLPKDLQLSVKLLVCSLNTMLESLQVSEDIYCLGHTSRIVGSELASLSWAKQRRKTAQRKSSLVIVDRTLDMPNIVGHHWETHLDRILALLPHLPNHSNDVMVNMTQICSVGSGTSSDVIVPGCLSHHGDTIASDILQTLSTNKPKESLMEVNRQLVEAASRENLPIKLSGRPGRVTAEQLLSHTTHFKGKTKLMRKNKGLLQMVLAVCESLRHADNTRLDGLLGLEKGLLQSIGEEEDYLCLTQLISSLSKDRSDRIYELGDIFLLLVYLYSLLDEKEDVEFLTEERKLQAILVDCIISETDHLPPFLKELVGEEPRKETVSLIVQDIFERLHALSRTRENLQQFDVIYEPGDMTSQASLIPLMKSLVKTIFDPAKPELPDLLYKSTGFRDLLKSGFGLFMNVNKPRPSDLPAMIVFIIGGTTCTEVKQIREAAGKTDVQIIIGSTRLVSPTDILHQIFVSDHLHPKH